MRVVQTQQWVPLVAVKPLDGLLAYRAHCLAVSRASLRERRGLRRSPITGRPLERVGDIDGLPYGRCPASGGWFLMELPSPERWARVLEEVNRFRRSPETFHAELAQSRADAVYAPKLEWIGETLRLHGLAHPVMLEAMTAPSHFTTILRESALCRDVVTADEMALANGLPDARSGPMAQAAVLLESLDRVNDPAGLLRGVAGRLEESGLLFVTALVASGFDLSVLGLKNLYLYPPDRTNCFSLQGLSQLLERSGFDLVEMSTPGVLDIQIVRAHLARDQGVPLSAFERQLVEMDEEGQAALQAFLQQRGLSSFARIVARRRVETA